MALAQSRPQHILTATMTIRSVFHEFYRWLQLANDLCIWKELQKSNDEALLFGTDDYGVAENWTEWDTSSSID